MLVIVDDQIAGGKAPGLGDLRVREGGAGVADGGADAGQQLGGTEGLDQIVVGAVVQRLHLVSLVVPGGNHHNGQTGPLSHGAQHLQAVHIRQPQIQHDEVRTVGGDHGQRLFAGVDDDGVVAVGREDHRDEAADALLILHDQNLILDLHSCLPPVEFLYPKAAPR